MYLNPLPSQKQLNFLSWEFGLFFHFGIRTFYPGHGDWDMEKMSADRFLPEELDCEEWILAAKEAGAKYAIMTAKHHDGFALWPSRYTEFSVKASPWKDGKGDVVAEFVSACRKHGLGCGIYYSPADFSAKNGQTNGKEFEDYFIAQISELLTNYGKIDYLWFDGCGSENLVFDKGRIVKAIRALQPDIMIFNMWDPDVRWVGNELGFADPANSNLVDAVDFSVMTDKKEKLEKKAFLPAECDMRMREANWFTADDSDVCTVKSVETLADIYDCSVGRGANLLLNIGPASTGKLPAADKARLLEFGNHIKKRFSSPIPAAFEKGVVSFKKKEKVNLAVICEDLTKGERIVSFELVANGQTVYKGFTVGHKAICKFETVETDRIEIKITSSVGEPSLLSAQFFFEER